MRKFTLFLFSIVISLSLSAQSSGGPDLYGYTWKTQANSSAGAPTYNWIDITQSGTVVQGLNDDNVVGPLNIGFDFPFYWTAYNAIYVGSNGYISFGNINISSTAIGFPTFPTTDGLNNVIAPLLCDLSFASSQFGTANPGRVYLYSNNLDTAIISYVNAPFWDTNVNGYSGSNTFQIILSKVDSSVTFQYQNQTGIYNSAYNFSQNPVVVGIENVNETIGLTPYNDSLVTGNTAIKFDYPSSTSFIATDVGPAWAAVTDGKAFFYPINRGPYRGTAEIANVGNIGINDTITVDLTILDAIAFPRHSDVAKIPAIGLGGSINVPFNAGYQPNVQGNYTYRVVTSLTGDINARNDTLDVELAAVDTSGRSTTLTYWNGSALPGARISWNTGGADDGIGVYYKPPFYPVEITEIEAFVDVQGTQVGTNSFGIKVFADDGPPGQGTPLDSAFVSVSQVRDNAWNNLTFSDPIRIDSGGVYVGWYMTGTTVALGMETSLPISRRTYEVLNGAWADYRSNLLQDAMIQVKVDKACNVGIPLELGADTSLCSADTLFLDAGSGRSTINWSTGASSRTLAVTQPGTYFVSVEDSSFCRGRDTIRVSQLPSPTVDLGPDRSICDGDSLVLDAGGGLSGYLWSDGSMGQTLTVDMTGIYNVTIADSNGCQAVDEIIVTVAQPPFINLGPDVNGCVGDDIFLSGDPGFNYVWSTGEVTQTIQVDSAGKYWLTIADNLGCTATDTIEVFLDGGTLDLGPDVTFCEGDSVTLDAGPEFGLYLWSDGSSGQTLTVKTAGQYVVTAIEGSCTEEDTVDVTVDPLPIPSFTIVATSNPQRFAFQNTTQFGLSYTWDFGGGNSSTATSPIHTFPAPGNYVVCVTALNACGSRDLCDTVTTGNVGLEGLWLDEVKLFPNPTTGKLWVSIEGMSLGETRFSLSNAHGQLLRNEAWGFVGDGTRKTVDLSELPEGIYYLELKSPAHRLLKKIVLTK
jgi:hypothetical protein